MRVSIFGSSSIGLLGRLVFVHVFGTLFAYTVYIRSHSSEIAIFQNFMKNISWKMALI